MSSVTPPPAQAPRPVDPAIIASFKRRRQAMSASYFFMLAMIGATFLMEESTPGWVYKGFCALLLVPMAVMFWQWRCPACRVYLGGSFNPRFCSRCATPLAEVP
jgi:hypothetical protein